MQDKIKNHIDMLFEEAPTTRRALDLKEELVANLIERYHDLTENGMGEEEAYKNVINNIGDVSELINNLKESDILNVEKIAEDRKKTAKVVTISVALFFFATIILCASPFLGNPIAGFFIFMLSSIIPTCMLVYHFTSRPKYQKYDNSMVEEFKKWSDDSKHSNSIRGIISAILWLLIVIIYFVVSFATMAWWITWIIFLVGACIEMIFTLVLKIKNIK